MGMDPYEERLLIILLGSGVGLLALLTMLFVCFRKYRIDNKNPRHQRAQQRAIGFGWQQPGAGPMGRHQMIYQPTGHQPTGGLAMMEPGMLDPGVKAADLIGYYPHRSLPQQPLLANSDSV